MIQLAREHGFVAAYITFYNNITVRGVFHHIQPIHIELGLKLSCLDFIQLVSPNKHIARLTEN